MVAHCILIVDDNPGILDLLSTVATSIEFSIKTSTNHLEFKQQLADFRETEMLIYTGLFLAVKFNDYFTGKFRCYCNHEFFTA